MKSVLFSVALAGLTCSAWANEAAVPPQQAEIEKPALLYLDTWVREAPPTAKMSAAYMRIQNTGDRARQLIGGFSSAFGQVEVHETIMEGDLAKMRHIEALTIPAKGTVELKPGGYHIMLMQRKEVLKAGDMMNLTLEYADGHADLLMIEVKKAGAQTMPHHHQH